VAIDTGKTFDTVPLFDPEVSNLVRAPLGDGPGWWAGAPGATFDAQSNTFYLVYRQRQPRELGRGVELRIAASDNGIAFTDIWALPKTSLDALSVERASLIRGLDGRWLLYLCYVYPEDGRWRVGLVEADEPDAFDVTTMTTLLIPEDFGAIRMKDPNVFIIGRMTYLLVTYATEEPAPNGLPFYRTGIAMSGDGRRFQWMGDATPMMNYPALPNAGPAWDGHCRRIGAMVPLETGGWLAFYDGSASADENYEERTGIAQTFDLRTFYSLTPDHPALFSRHATGCLRFVDVVQVGRELFYYYEIARADGAHELRVSVVERT